MNLKTLSDDLDKVSQAYTKKFGIERDSYWFLLKLQEEVGELTQSYLMMIGQARQKGKSHTELEQEFHKELADVFAHVLLLAKHHDVNLEKMISEKWLVWNTNQ